MRIITALSMSLAIVACDDVGAITPEAELTTTTAAITTPVDPAKELFVTALSVVDDPRYTTYKKGKWNIEEEGGFSFGRLIDNMSSVERPSDAARSDFVMNWLRTWETPQTVNGQVIAARPLVRPIIITPWKLRSIGKFPGNTAATCSESAETDFTCKLSFAPADVPFELIAVVNRPDLRVVPENTDFESWAAGQGRFIFVLVDADRNPLPFTVIFEYMVPIKGKPDIKAYHDKWNKLGDKAFGAAFNKDLHKITTTFSKWNAAPWRNNGSALLQLRINDVVLAEPGSDPSHPFGVMWELREFVVGDNGQLVPDTTKQEPPLALSGTPLLDQWLNENAAAILIGKHEVPATYQGQPFLAASSIAPFDFVWQTGPTVDDSVRSAFAINTCNGCHVNETATGFLHTFQFFKGEPATLSQFLIDELAANGPRVADFRSILETDIVKDGKGKDKGNKPKKPGPPHTL